MDAPAPPVTTILLFRGKPALAAFRRERLVERARALEPAVADLDKRWIYFVRTSDASGWIVQRLERLLDASCVMREQAIAALGCAIVVTPRPGTISAWSSKATDIARHCGLGCVARIERGIAWTIAQTGGDPDETSRTLAESGLLHDRMTQRAHLPKTFLRGALESDAGAEALFLDGTPPSHSTIRLGADARAALEGANASLGLALSPGELDYLAARFLELGRDPTDAELMMFAQVNSEHCRHKTFNASWTIDGAGRERSLFDMIRHTQACNPGEVLSAYRDNAAVVRGHSASWFVADPDTARYSTVPGRVELVMKVETHNHPTAISPFPGAATGSGGEIRDEAATGRGARSKAGVAGFSVSNLRIPGFVQPWEHDLGRPSHIASALEIMLDGPIGAAAFNNEFGRPALGGYFRTFEIDVARAATSGGSGAGDPAARSAGAARGDFAGQEDDVGAGRRSRVYGYHKPIMIAGGVGNIRTDQVRKSGIAPGARLVVLGGPAMLIGLGGGAASSSGSRSGEESLDFASVQRENPEMQRRCQEVIDRCWQLGADNPILSIHDVGAGGLSNALPELVDGAGRGGRIELRAIPCDDPAMSPLEIWCNESQERYVLAIEPGRLDEFAALCARERCPWADLGEATPRRRLEVHDARFHSSAVSMPMDVLLGELPRTRRDAVRVPAPAGTFHTGRIEVGRALERVLRVPAVADKSFLVTIGDRTVGGLVARDPMVGPWQVPVADCAVTLSGFHGFTGEALAMGERTPLALLDACAAARMAVAEALTNIASADVASIDRVVLSANWMAACGEPGEDADLFDAVEAVAMELCPALGISIPVGKDSLSMSTTWRDDSGERKVVSPVSLVVSAFAPVDDARASLVPMLRTDIGESSLLLADLGYGANRLGGSALALSHERLGAGPPDLDRPEALPALFRVLSHLRREGLVAAYHDRSDGGLAACVLEMAFAGRAGFDIELGPLGPDPIAALFCEEPGAVLQVRDADLAAVCAVFRSEPSLAPCVHRIGRVERGDRVRFAARGRTLHETSRTGLHRIWSQTSYRMQRLRDDPGCADEEHARIADANERGLWCATTFGIAGMDDVDTAIRRRGRRRGRHPGRRRRRCRRRRGRRCVQRPSLRRGRTPSGRNPPRAGSERTRRDGRVISRGGLRRVRRAHERSGERTRLARRVHRPRGLRRLLVRRRARSRRRVGALDPLQPPLPRRVRGVLPSRRHVHPRCVQRMPDAGAPARPHPGRGRLAPLRAQPLRAVRGAAGDDPDWRISVALPRGDGRLGASHRGRARRGPRGVRRRRAHPCDPRPAGLPAIRGIRRRSRRTLSRQSERLAGRRGRRDDSRRAGDHHDAAPRAHHPGRAALVASAALGRERAVAADVRECEEMGGLTVWKLTRFSGRFMSWISCRTGSASTHQTVTRPSNKMRLQPLIAAPKSNALVAALANTAKASSLRSFGSASPTRPSPLRMKGITGLDTSSACVS